MPKYGTVSQVLLQLVVASPNVGFFLKLIILMIYFENNFTGSLVAENHFREINYRISEIFIIIQQSICNK